MPSDWSMIFACIDTLPLLIGCWNSLCVSSQPKNPLLLRLYLTSDWAREQREEVSVSSPAFISIYTLCCCLSWAHFVASTALQVQRHMHVSRRTLNHSKYVKIFFAPMPHVLQLQCAAVPLWHHVTCTVQDTRLLLKINWFPINSFLRNAFMQQPVPHLLIQI